MDRVKLTGKTVIVTGSNTGIGKETAKELAKRGARVVLACRNAERGNAAVREIIEDTKNENVVCQILDLSSLSSIKKFADDFNQNETRLDILVNNAGIWVTERSDTPDGFETEFGTNHLGHFYLTNLLLQKLKASTPSRVVTVSSKLHTRGKLNFEDLQFEQNWSAMVAYSRSKAANALFSVHLAKILAGTGVTTYSMHPGVIQTELSRNYTGCIKCLYTYCIACCLSTPEQGARTTLYCCLEPSIAEHTGRYYEDCRETAAASHASNAETAEKLWKISCELCHIEKYS